MLVFVSNQANILLNYLFPPIGLTALSFIGIASFLLLCGTYSVALAVDSNIRIRKSICVLGIKSMIQFSVSNKSPSVSRIDYSLPIIDIVRRLYGQYNHNYEDLKIYPFGQDSLHMKNNQDMRFALGQTCPNCKTGKLGGTPSEFTASEDMSFRANIERFECDSCHKLFSNSMAVTWRWNRIQYSS
jgi:hypothetical protein